MRPSSPPRRTPITALVVALLFLFHTAALAGPANLRRRPAPERLHEARGRPGADARPIIDATLREAGLPTADANNPWRELVNQYFLLDHRAQAEPRSYTEGRFVPNAWFTHGARHFIDLARLMVDNKDFVKDIWHAMGLTNGPAKEQAFRDLLIALIGHDSQQLGFADPKERVREDARVNHPFNGGVATAVAYLRNAGDNPAGARRALMLGLAAAGHSKSAVDFANPNLQPNPGATPPRHTRGSSVMLDAILERVNAEMTAANPAHVPITLTGPERAAIIEEARRIGVVLGAMDSLRERGPGSFGAHPTGEHMVYRVVPGQKALEVFNTRENRRVTLLEGVSHRTYVEYHTVVERLNFDGRAFDMRVTFADADIPTEARRKQVEDIQLDFARSGFPCVVHYSTFEGRWAQFPPP